MSEYFILHRHRHWVLGLWVAEAEFLLLLLGGCTYYVCMWQSLESIYLPTYIYIFRRKVNSERVAPGHPLLTSVRCIEWWMVSVERREAFSALSQPSGF